MKKQVVVVGLGRFGASVSKTLYQIGHDVLAIDKDEGLVQEMLGKATYPVKADGTNEAVLRELGVQNFDAAIVAIGSDTQASLMATVLLKSLEVPYVVARAENPLHGQTLERIGANRVLYPELEMGARSSHSLFIPDVMEYMELTSKFGITKLKVPKDFVKKTLKDSGLGGARDKYGVVVLAIITNKNLVLLPDEEEGIQGGDILIVSSGDEGLEKILTKW